MTVRWGLATSRPAATARSTANRALSRTSRSRWGAAVARRSASGSEEAPSSLRTLLSSLSDVRSPRTCRGVGCGAGSIPASRSISIPGLSGSEAGRSAEERAGATRAAIRAPRAVRERRA